MATTNHTDRGRSLARGPALILGSILLAFGLIAMIKHSAFPSFGDNFPDADVKGLKFLGIEVNGWTNWLIAVAGGVLLFGAAQHLLSKVLSLIVGLVLAAAAVIALIDGDILGLGAANIWTVIGLGAAALVLLVNALLPRVGGGKDRDHDGIPDRDEDTRLRRERAETRTRGGAVSVSDR